MCYLYFIKYRRAEFVSGTLRRLFFLVLVTLKLARSEAWMGMVPETKTFKNGKETAAVN